MATSKRSPNKGNTLQKDFPLFRERLETRRKELNLTRAQLAEKSGVSERTLAKWVLGEENDYGVFRYTPPSLGNLVKVASALDVSIDYFVNPDMTCHTMTNQMIHDITGLSDGAIDKLKKCRNHPISSYAADIINILLTARKGGEIIGNIHRYITVSNKGYTPVPSSSDDNSEDLYSETAYLGTPDDLRSFWSSKVAGNLLELKQELDKG